MYDKLSSFIKVAHLSGYPATENQMLHDMISGIMENETLESNTYFCSKLISDTYMHMGLLSRDYVSNSYMPKDFSDLGSLPLLGRTFLITGPYFEVKK